MDLHQNRINKRFTVTYEIVSPESAEHGEAESIGFVTSGESYDDIETALKEPNEAYQMSLREALALANPDENYGRWFAETGQERCNYATGEIEQREIHPPKEITSASYNRIKRLLKIR